MKHIIIDLEMNWIAKNYRVEREICNMEVIQIGAIALNENYEEISSFKTFVKPRYNDVVGNGITKITGITTEMVANSPRFEEALEMFFSWCQSFNEDVWIYQWSENDLDQILKEMQLKEMKLDSKERLLLEGWYDFQKEYTEKLKLSNAVSLKNAVMYAGLEFLGQEHDALWDARNTGILLKIIRDPELCKEALDYVIEILTPKTLSTSLGDLFDFNDLLGISA